MIVFSLAFTAEYRANCGLAISSFNSHCLRCLDPPPRQLSDSSPPERLYRQSGVRASQKSFLPTNGSKPVVPRAVTTFSSVAGPRDSPGSAQ